MHSPAEPEILTSPPVRHGRIRALHPRFQLWASFGPHSSVALGPGRDAAGFASWMAGIALRFWADQTRSQQECEDDGVDRRFL